VAVGAPTTQRQAVPVRQRPNIAEMTAPQIAELREAFAKLQEWTDDRGYQALAAVHGLPLKIYCDLAHGQPAFLPWHRAYLYRFEQALRDTGHDVMLPWWDWTTARGVPSAYDEENRPGGESNPLHSVRINDLALQQGAEGRGDELSFELAEIPDTIRRPGRSGTDLPTPKEIRKILDYREFQRFTLNIEDVHGKIHMWVGGHMSDIPYAAYDPIFWAHHCMIDRLWRIWQLEHTQSSFPVEVMGQVMEPFHLTAAQVLDPTALGYDYAISLVQVRP
jgi:tyrosinase